jgi:hypothetical protein
VSSNAINAVSEEIISFHEVGCNTIKEAIG